MSEYNLPEEYDFEDEVSLDQDEKNVGGQKQDWFKMTQKGQQVRASFVYFHSVDANAVSVFVKKARKNNEKVTREQVLEVAKQALEQRASELEKSVDELTDIEKLDLSKNHFKALKAHYQEGLGYVISRLGKDGADADEVWKRLPDPKTSFTTLLLIYPTNSEGTINAAELKDQIKNNKLNLMPWRFSNRVYEEVWKANNSLRHNDLTLASQDVLLECKDPKFHNISVSAVGKAIWQQKDTLRNAVLRSATNMYDKLVPFRELTTDQLREKLGLGGGISEADVSLDNFDDVLEGV